MEYGTSEHDQSQMGTTIKIEEEEPATSNLYIDSKIDLNHLKQEPGLEQSVKSEPTMLVKREIAENSNEAALEHGASQSVKEQLQTEMTIKTVTVHVDSKINHNSWKPDPGFVHSVKIEPALLVKEEIPEDSSHDSCEKQCIHDTPTPVSTGGVNENFSTSLDDLFNVKYETADIDVRPTVLQHMDVHYTINKNVSTGPEENSLVDDCNEEMPGSGVKKGSAEAKWRDNKVTSQNCAQATTEVEYDKVHMKSLLGHPVRLEKVDLQKHIPHQCASSSNDFKWDRTFHKQQQRNRRKAVTTKGTVADPSNQIGDKGIKAKQRGLTTLMRVHTGERPYECDACHAKFSQRGDLTMHMRVHTGEKPYECDTCLAKFARKGYLTNHMRVHTGEKPYECDVCHIKFAQRGVLTTHMKVHTGEKPYECNACQSKFAQRGDLTIHMRVHTGEKPYKCNACHAKFSQRGSLTIHKRVHTGEKPFECDACHARFARRDGLNTHMKVHTGEKPYECDTCHTKFARRGVLITHIKVHRSKKRY